MAVSEKKDISSILEGEQFINLTTFRKNGTGVKTPVWFAEDNGTLYVFTNADSYKVKRIRNTPDVTFAACNARGDIHGETLEGQAQIHEPKTPVAKKADQLLNKKYGLMKRAFNLLGWIRGSDPAFIEIKTV